MKKPIVALAAFFIINLYGCSESHSQLQARADKSIQQVVKNFNAQLREDTIDFNSLAPFPWDTVYVFHGYTDGSQLREGLGYVDWDNVMDDGDMVPEDNFRLIFVDNNVAVQYLDIGTDLLGKTHYPTYSRDESGRFNSSLQTEKGHRYISNRFSRAEARFIIVCGIDVPVGDTTAYRLAPLRFFIQQHASGVAVDPTNLRELHPVSGCGYPHCLANRKSTL